MKKEFIGLSVVLLVVALLGYLANAIYTQPREKEYDMQAVVVEAVEVNDHYKIYLQSEDGNVWVLEHNFIEEGTQVILTMGDNMTPEKIEDDRMLEVQPL